MIFKKLNISAVSATKVLFSVISLESLIVFFALAFQPSAPESRAVFLYSAPRFLELGIAAFIFGFSVWGTNKVTTPSWKKKLKELLSHPQWNFFFLYSGIALFTMNRFTSIALQAFSEGIDLHYLAGYNLQLLPLFFLFSLLGIQIIIWSLYVTQKLLLNSLKTKKRRFIIAGIIWTAVSILSILSIFLENIKEVVARGNVHPYSPLLEWYIFIVWIVFTATVLTALQQEKALIHKHSSLINQTFLIAALIAIIGIVFQFSLQSTMRPYAKDQFYFQKWSSEDIMQTVSLEDLKKYPFETLNNIHVKPPALDAIRATLVHLWPSEHKPTSLLHVDFLLYKLWILLYGFLGAIIFLWITELANTKLALISSLVFYLHPANILYATLLDSTFLTSFFVCLFYYMLWKTKNKHKLSIAWLIFSVLFLFFTRAIFQIPFLITISLSLLSFKVKKQKTLIFLIITGSIFGAYTLKQYHKFNIFSTSSFTGLNLNRSVGNLDTKNPWGVDLTLEENKKTLASTLTRTKKINGQTNFNHINYLQFNQELTEQFRKYVAKTPISKIIMSYWENLTLYTKPSSRYSQNVIVEHIFWRTTYDKIFSAPILPTLLFLLGIPWAIKTIKNKDYLPYIGFALPGLYIFATTVLFEKGENMRFKFFIEPLLFVFLATQLHELIQKYRKHPVAKLK